MPPPIMPAPRMPTFFTLLGATSFGRDAPFLMALSWYHSVLMRFFDSWLITQGAMAHICFTPSARLSPPGHLNFALSHGCCAFGLAAIQALALAIRSARSV